MPISILYMLLFSGIAIIYFIADHYSKKNTILRQINTTNKVKINDCKQNEYVQIVGKAITGNKTLKAPFSHRPCIGYYICAEKYSNSSWHLIGEEKRFQNFFLEDNEGHKAMVKPGSLNYDFKKVFFEVDFEHYTEYEKKTAPHLEKFLEKYGEQTNIFLKFNNKIRFKEGIIDVNEKISVIGISQWKVIKDATENYNNTKVLLITGTKSKPLTITDLKY